MNGDRCGDGSRYKRNGRFFRWTYMHARDAARRSLSYKICSYNGEGVCE